ncbi:MAG TPA: cytochrome c, partial [Opitutaceae bacterium]|nr:cytochrome c [Opitutaceae bacterium]
MSLHVTRGACFAALFFLAAGLSAAEADAASVARGQTLYLAHCTICHGVAGAGVKGTYPPLAGSDWLAANRREAIRAVVGGLKSEIVVNGETYNGLMPAIIIDDAQVADTLTFVLNSWGNSGESVTVEE